MDIDRVVFVYRHTFTGKVRATYIDGSRDYDDHPDYKHIGSLEPRAWIQATLNDNPALAEKMEE